MEKDNIARLPGVKEMTQAYDPTYSYVVIEHRMGAQGETDFLKIDEALSCFKKKIVNQELVKDPSTGAKRLIIKMKQLETEEIMMAILGTHLKTDFHCYIY